MRQGLAAIASKPRGGRDLSGGMPQARERSHDNSATFYLGGDRGGHGTGPCGHSRYSRHGHAQRGPGGFGYHEGSRGAGRGERISRESRCRGFVRDHQRRTRGERLELQLVVVQMGLWHGHHGRIWPIPGYDPRYRL